MKTQHHIIVQLKSGSFNYGTKCEFIIEDNLVKIVLNEDGRKETILVAPIEQLVYVKLVREELEQ